MFDDHPFHALRGDREATSRVDPAEDATTRIAPSRGWVCAACEAFLASEHDLVAVGGSTHHERVNPGAFVHRFITLCRCEAAVPVSTPTDDFTWFDGYEWQIVNCRRCGTHLGWRFVSADLDPPCFFGILVDRARERLGG